LSEPVGALGICDLGMRADEGADDQIQRPIEAVRGRAARLSTGGHPAGRPEPEHGHPRARPQAPGSLR
jgi:hypothetical protein